MENPLVFSGETMKTEQQCSEFPSGEKLETPESLGIDEEDLENLLYFAERAREEVAVKFQESGNGGGALPRVRAKSGNLEAMDFYCAFSLIDLSQSEKAFDEFMRKKVQSSARFSLLPLRLVNLYREEVPKKQRNTKGKPAAVSTGDGFLKKFGTPVSKNSESISSNPGRIEQKLDSGTISSNTKRVQQKTESGKGKTLISAIKDPDLFKKLGKDRIADFVVNFKRKRIKRYRDESEELEEKENQSKSKKQKGGKQKTQIFKNDLNAKLSEWGLIPPPNMPDEFKTLIQNMGGSEEKLLFQKIIYKTDLSKGHNRLQIPVSQVTVDFLTENERTKIEGNGMNVLLVEPKLKTSTIHFTKWNMKSSKVYVFNEQWHSVVEGNETLKQNEVMQIWSFRVAPESRLCFAMVNVKKGDDD